MPSIASVRMQVSFSPGRKSCAGSNVTMSPTTDRLPEYGPRRSPCTRKDAESTVPAAMSWSKLTGIEASKAALSPGPTELTRTG